MESNRPRGDSTGEAANAPPLALITAAAVTDAGETAELTPAPATSTLLAAHTGVVAGVGSGSDSDEPPEEISNEEATAQEMYLRYLETSFVPPPNPFPLVRPLETIDDWSDEDHKLYFDHLCYEKEKGRRYLRQFELDYIQTYSTRIPQGHHTRFAA